jgi:hypothetical protein
MNPSKKGSFRYQSMVWRNTYIQVYDMDCHFLLDHWDWEVSSSHLIMSEHNPILTIWIDGKIWSCNRLDHRSPLDWLAIVWINSIWRLIWRIARTTKWKHRLDRSKTRYYTCRRRWRCHMHRISKTVTKFSWTFQFKSVGNIRSLSSLVVSSEMKRGLEYTITKNIKTSVGHQNEKKTSRSWDVHFVWKYVMVRNAHEIDNIVSGNRFLPISFALSSIHQWHGVLTTSILNSVSLYQANEHHEDEKEKMTSDCMKKKVTFTRFEHESSTM